VLGRRVTWNPPSDLVRSPRPRVPGVVPVTGRDSVDRVREWSEPGIFLNLSGWAERVVSGRSLVGIAPNGPAPMPTIISLRCAGPEAKCSEAQCSGHRCRCCDFLQIHRDHLFRAARFVNQLKAQPALEILPRAEQRGTSRPPLTHWVARSIDCQTALLLVFVSRRGLPEKV
jgi:hypothetical protein